MHYCKHDFLHVKWFCNMWIMGAVLSPFNLRCFHFSKHLIIHLTGYYCFVLFFICLSPNEIIFLEHILRCQFDLDGVSLSTAVTFHLLLKESFSKSSPNVSYSFIRAQHRWSSKDTSPLSRSTHAVSELWPALPFSDCSEACAEWEHNAFTAYVKGSEFISLSDLQRQHMVMKSIL